MAAAGALALPLGILARAAVIAAVLWHAWLHRGRRAETLIATADGLWALPQRQLTTLRLATSTRYADGWIDLHLRGDRGAIRLLLLRDQFGAEDWRRLQAQLRRARVEAGLS